MPDPILTRKDYLALRKQVCADVTKIEALERAYMNFLVKVTVNVASQLEIDFGKANSLRPFWSHYAPKQRGRAPTGSSSPWSEVGEKSLSSNLIRAIGNANDGISFPGLPFGGDVRFATPDAFIHFDIKLTGPNDRPDEVVAPPQQVSGDGAEWDGAVINNRWLVKGSRAKMPFQPKLPPFYVLDGAVQICLTYFLKAVYIVQSFGIQPLHYMEIICVPNGLLMFDGPRYADTPGLLIPGKDDRKKREDDKRTRIRLVPLAGLGGKWRCMKIELDAGKWRASPRTG